MDRTNDFEYPKTCWLESIFDRQNELREKYHSIETANGLMRESSVPVDLHDRIMQHLIKDMAWRFTEEIGEAHECLQMYRDGTNIWRNSPAIPRFQEELIDALHFLTELSILVGMVPGDIANPGLEPSSRLDDLLLHEVTLSEVIVDDLYQKAFEVVMYMGLTCNQLKNKPWKQTHTPTDTERFRRLLAWVWHHFGELLYMSGLDSAGVYDLYIRKNEINKLRQENKY